MKIINILLYFFIVSIDHNEPIDDEDFNAEVTLNVKPLLAKLLQVLTVDIWQDVDDRAQRRHFEAMQHCSDLWNNIEKGQTMADSLKQELKKPNFDECLSLYHALKQICDARDFFKKKDPNLLETTDLTDSEVIYLQSFHKCIHPVSEAIDILIRKSEFSYFLVILLNLRKKLKLLEREMRSSQCRWHILVESQIKGLEQRFDGFFQMDDEGTPSAIASFSDPNFKFRWLQRFENANHREVIKQRVLSSMAEEVTVTGATVTEQPANHDSLEDLLTFSQDENAMPAYDFNEAHTTLTAYTKDSRTNREMLKEFPLLLRMFSKYNSVPLSVNNLLTNDVMKSIPTFLQLSNPDFEYSVLYKINVENQK